MGIKIGVMVIGGLCLLRVLMIYVSNRKKNNKSLKKNETSSSSNSEEDGGEILEYSREMSCKLGKRTNINPDREIFIRPSSLRRKGYADAMISKSEKIKMANKRYAKALSNLITIKEFRESISLNNKSLRGFVESMNGTVITLRDNSSAIDVDLQYTYDVVGQFIIINFNKEGDGTLQVNYILLDN